MTKNREYNPNPNVVSYKGKYDSNKYTLEEYLEHKFKYKFNMDEIVFGGYSFVLLIDKYRALRLTGIKKDEYDNDIYSKIKNRNFRNLSKVYSSGVITLPKLVNSSPLYRTIITNHSYVDRNYLYTMLERVNTENIDQIYSDIFDDFTEILSNEKYYKELDRIFYNNRVNIDDFANIYVSKNLLYDIIENILKSNIEDYEVLLKIIKEEKKEYLYDFLYIFYEIYKNFNYVWKDCHVANLGLNKKGRLVAIDYLPNFKDEAEESNIYKNIVKYKHFIKESNNDDETLKDYLSRKIGLKNIGECIGEGGEGVIMELDNYRVLKITKYKNKIDYSSKVKNKNLRNICKVYSSGTIQIPKKYTRIKSKENLDELPKLESYIKLRSKNNRLFNFQIIEKLTIDEDLLLDISDEIIDTLKKLDLYKEPIVTSLNRGDGIGIFGDTYMNRSKYNDNKKLCKIIIKYSKYKKHLIGILNAIESLESLNINFYDIHNGQFGFDKNGKIKAFDFLPSHGVGYKEFKQNINESSDNDNDNILKALIKDKLNINIKEFIDKGSFGSVFAIDNYRVIKLFKVTHKNDLYTYHKNKNSEYTVKVYSTGLLRINKKIKNVLYEKYPNIISNKNDKIGYLIMERVNKNDTYKIIDELNRDLSLSIYIEDALQFSTMIADEISNVRTGDDIELFCNLYSTYLTTNLQAYKDYIQYIIDQSYYPDLIKRLCEILDYFYYNFNYVWEDARKPNFAVNQKGKIIAIDFLPNDNYLSDDYFSMEAKPYKHIVKEFKTFKKENNIIKYGKI